MGSEQKGEISQRHKKDQYPAYSGPKYGLHQQPPIPTAQFSYF
jgi:hypothetical protein